MLKAINEALAKAYPTADFMVGVAEDGSMVQIMCPNLSQRYGMTLHNTGDMLTLVRKAVMSAGELLERFRVSREQSDYSHLRRKINGEVAGIQLGEQ